jgi:hypothetical protein
VIISNSMKQLLKIGHHGVISQLRLLYVQTSRPSSLVVLQNIIDNHSKVFGLPKGLPPTQDHYHVIHLQLGSVLPSIRPYEIAHMIQEILEVGIIQPSQSDFSSLVAMVQKN